MKKAFFTAAAVLVLTSAATKTFAQDKISIPSATAINAPDLSTKCRALRDKVVADLLKDSVAHTSAQVSELISPVVEKAAEGKRLTPGEMRAVNAYLNYVNDRVHKHNSSPKNAVDEAKFYLFSHQRLTLGITKTIPGLDPDLEPDTLHNTKLSKRCFDLREAVISDAINRHALPLATISVYSSNVLGADKIEKVSKDRDLYYGNNSNLPDVVIKAAEGRKITPHEEQAINKYLEYVDKILAKQDKGYLGDAIVDAKQYLSGSEYEIIQDRGRDVDASRRDVHITKLSKKCSQIRDTVVSESGDDMVIEPGKPPYGTLVSVTDFVSPLLDRAAQGEKLNANEEIVLNRFLNYIEIAKKQAKCSTTDAVRKAKLYLVPDETKVLYTPSEPQKPSAKNGAVAGIQDPTPGS